jgi:hypothetical protein
MTRVAILLLFSFLPVIQAVLYRGRLPELVASNFDGAGYANAYMARDSLLFLMIAVALGSGLLQLGISWIVRHLDVSLINIPHRDYWLTPDRRALAIRKTEFGLLWFHVLLMLFLTYVDYLVFEANLLPEPKLSDSFLPALVAFLGLTGLWTFWMIRSFRKPDGQPSTPR